jgi:hypothetical protein
LIKIIKQNGAHTEKWVKIMNLETFKKSWVGAKQIHAAMKKEKMKKLFTEQRARRTERILFLDVERTDTKARILRDLSIVFLLCLLPSFGFARQGGISDGGGNASSGGDLLDFAEGELGAGKISFNPNGIACKAEFEKIYKNFSDNLSNDFGQVLRNSITSQKAWYFVNQVLPRLQNERISIQMDDQGVQQIAIQTPIEIYIYRPWFEGQDCAHKVGLIVHEGLMSIAMNYDLPRDYVRDVNRTIFAGDLGGSFPNRTAFYIFLRKTGFLKPVEENREAKLRNVINFLDTFIAQMRSTSLSKIQAKELASKVATLKSTMWDDRTYQYGFQAMDTVRTIHSSLQHKGLTAADKEDLAAQAERLKSYLEKEIVDLNIYLQKPIAIELGRGEVSEKR